MAVFFVYDSLISLDVGKWIKTPVFSCLACSLAMFVLLLILGIVRSATFNIPFRQFSLSPSLAGVGSSDNHALNYGSAQLFIDYVQLYTSNLAPVGTKTVTFEAKGISWQPAAGCTVLTTIGQKTGCVNVNRTATVDAGNIANPVWGFIPNSGTFFGPYFEDYFRFLSSPTGAGNESGLDLMQRLLDNRGANVQIIPAVGSPRQAAGYLQMDANVVGLGEICKANWTWRFLPPAQQVLTIACQNLVGNETRLNFVNAVPGLSVVGAVQSGVVTAFEFAAAIDNYDARTGGFFPLNGYNGTCTATNTPPRCLLNAGELGLRFIHYPGWHQPWFSAYLYINKDVWNLFEDDQKTAIKEAGFNAMIDSFHAVDAVECLYTQLILSINDNALQRNLDGTLKDCNPNKQGLQTCSADMLLTQWTLDDIVLFRQAAQQWTDSLAGPSPNQQDLATLLNAFQDFATGIDFSWKRERFPRGCNNAQTKK